MTAAEHFHVLIIGAGLSGIGAAYHLQRRTRGKSYAILEARNAIGGTWDLFRYPGVRSDSDMHTLGYGFKPWVNAKAIADGPAIRTYVRECADENGITPHIRFRHNVKRASWSSQEARWTIEADHQGQTITLSADFVLMCAGYYKYGEGYRPDFPGMERFKGRLIHPQFWPEDLDYGGKRVVVIGSGATAVTLVPQMARDAAKVTMLQRSPTYMVSRPSRDEIANSLRRYFPEKIAYGLTRWKNVLLQMLFFRLARKRPEKTKERLIGLVKEALPPNYDVATHFTPRYNPWDQRLCLVTDNDMFDAISQGRADVVTDQVETFTERGIKLKSGAELEADIIVTATGLVLETAGGAELFVDGRSVDFSKCFVYKGMMYNDVPNLANVFGYTNASWTLKADLTSEYVCRLINYMDRKGYRQATPRNSTPDMPAEPWVDFSSGYIQRALKRLPKQGRHAPWKLYQNYARDMLSLRFGKLTDEAMEFKKGPAQTPAGQPAKEAELRAAAA